MMSNETNKHKFVLATKRDLRIYKNKPLIEIHYSMSFKEMDVIKSQIKLPS